MAEEVRARSALRRSSTLFVSPGAGMQNTASGTMRYTRSRIPVAIQGTDTHVHRCVCLLTHRRNGWGASAVDALSTAIIMQQWDIVMKITDYIPTIDYSKSVAGETVSLFETTIRYIGGMLSGYDLLTGPLKNSRIPVSSVARRFRSLLTKNSKRTFVHS